jgi:ubiquinone/menaquinone biosynthesis C-methylase UbiE
LIQEVDIKRQVQDFYNSVGWKQIGEGVYQNARYEDLRPVSREYIHRCHLRVARFLSPTGKYLLDAGSGPIQYPEYLEYSKGYQHRVCLDISILALQEARERIGDRGLFVVADIARLPFKHKVFDGVVSLHTVHHLPEGEHKEAFSGFYDMLKPGRRAVVVYTWGEYSPLMRLFEKPIQWMTRLVPVLIRIIKRQKGDVKRIASNKAEVNELLQHPGTFTCKHDYAWIMDQLSFLPGLEVRVWRSVSTRFLRAFIFRRALGSFWLKLLFWMEEIAPQLFGRIGQYPMILFSKPRNSIPSQKGFYQ